MFKRRSFFSYRLNQSGSLPHGFSFIVFLLFIFAMVGTFNSVTSHASAQGNAITSGVSGYCLDVRHSENKVGAAVDSYGCNDTEAQSWQLDGALIKHGSYCLTLNSASKVVLGNCNSASNTIWLEDQDGIMNPNSQDCLSLPAGGSTGEQLIGADCGSLRTSSETWSPKGKFTCSATTPGQKIACAAIVQWDTWNSVDANHEALLNTYTDGAPYEEWCADFVSYVYKQAGYPFQNGETNGWDENNANNIVNQGFTTQPLNNYTPMPGDIGFFNYEGGHVEIVISGGPQPTFIYGNSASIDPSTGNGKMAANTITQDGTVGSLQYYLTPNI